MIDIYLDLDDLLTDTARTFHSKLFPHISNLEFHRLMEVHKKCSDFPIVKNNPEIYSRLLEYINSNLFNEKIKPIQENVDFFNQIHHHNWRIAGYMTARPIIVENGTKKWIQKHWLPNVEIYYKPSNKYHISDAQWKIWLLKELSSSWILVDDNMDLLWIKDNSTHGIVIYSPFKENYNFIDKNLGIYSDISWILNHITIC
jgi:hypothetical protein